MLLDTRQFILVQSSHKGNKIGYILTERSWNIHILQVAWDIDVLSIGSCLTHESKFFQKRSNNGSETG